MVRAIIHELRPAEFLMLILFGLNSIPLLTGKNFLTGLIAAASACRSPSSASAAPPCLRYNFGTNVPLRRSRADHRGHGPVRRSQAIDLVFTAARSPTRPSW
jgi:hypothetical protein